MIYIVRINDTEYEVDVERGEAEIVSTKAVETAPAPVTAVAAPVASPAPSAPTENIQGEKVSAPMPGNILKINVAAGETVKSGQILLILEAMKMENEIVAPRDGKIAQIITTQGASVTTGDTLLTLE